MFRLPGKPNQSQLTSPNQHEHFSLQASKIFYAGWNRVMADLDHQSAGLHQVLAGWKQVVFGLIYKDSKEFVQPRVGASHID